MIFKFKFPDIGEGITEGEIISWHVKVGDKIKEDQTLLEIETDKAVAKVPSPKSGKILKLGGKNGEIIKVGQVLVEIEIKGKINEKQLSDQMTEKTLENSTTQKTLKKRKDIGAVVGSLEEASDNEEQGEKIYVKNVTKKSSSTSQTIPQIKVQKKYDMYGYVSRVELKGIRKTIATNLQKTVTTAALVTAMDDVNITKLKEIKEHKKSGAEKKKIKLTYLPYMIRAIVLALKKHPYLNSELTDTEIILKKYYNIGIAVDTDRGLIVPILKGADQKTILQIAKEIDSLAQKTRDRKINLGDLKGGTFSVTNYGSIGGNYGTPLTNHPEAAILGVGRSFEKLVKVNNKIETQLMLPLSLTFDHRITDGADAARFMQTLKSYLENPKKMLN